MWLIFETFAERWPFDQDRDWLECWHRDWTTWVTGCEDLDVKQWLDVVTTGHLDEAMDALLSAEFDADAFNPFRDVTAQAQGYVLSSLQVAIWAMQWARKDDGTSPIDGIAPLTPVADVFEKRGYDVLGWIALVGRDADTYGAIAGPMIACAIGRKFPLRTTRHLAIHDQMKFLAI